MYFLEQARTTENYVIPFLELDESKSKRILEIGCGECGNLLPFIQKGYDCVGVDINNIQLEKGRKYLLKYATNFHYEIIHSDIYDLNLKDLGIFDVIIMRDVIEHIFNQRKFMAFVAPLLKPQGKFFLGFPPWQMPFGGHQQGCDSILRKLPFIHLLPRNLYRELLIFMGEKNQRVENLIDIWDTGISIDRFLRIVRDTKWNIEKSAYYFINPNYETKFGLKPRRVIFPLGHLPFFRNFYTTCMYVVLKKFEITNEVY